MSLKLKVCTQKLADFSFNDSKINIVLRLYRYFGCFDEDFGLLRFLKNSYYIHTHLRSSFLLSFELDYAGYTFSISSTLLVGWDSDNLRFPSLSNLDLKHSFYFHLFVWCYYISFIILGEFFLYKPGHMHLMVNFPNLMK